LQDEWVVTLSHPELLAEARRALESFEIEQLRDRGLIPLGGEYFPAIFYPPIPFCPPGTDEDLFRAPLAAAERPLSFYVHVPFCPGKCVYCHWTVTAGASLREMEAYLAAIDQELALYQTRFGGAIPSPRSILIGGGTPTMLPARLIDELFAILRRRLDLSQCAQIICEAEPATVLGEDGFAKLESLRANDVRRLSFGVQTFDDATLRAAVISAIAANPKAVADFKKGKDAAKMSIVGAVMKGNKGAPNDVVRKLVDEELGKV
jgi:oxygen-independent coproporphyrinogen-3 oxidase